MALQVLNGPVIAAGESLSDGLDCSAGRPVRITMPGDWTNANLTFQISTDGQFYNDLFDAHGNEATMVVQTGAAVPIPIEGGVIVNFLKVRSGSRNYPVPQDEERWFAIAIDVPEAEGA